MIAEFISPADSRWRDVLATTAHDFYHWPEYVAIAAQHEEGTPLAFYAADEDAQFLVPLLLHPTPSWADERLKGYDAVTPYGYPTPLVTAPDDTNQLARFLGAFRAVGANYGIVSAFIRLHPFLPLPYPCLSQFGELVRHGEVVYMDLTQPLSESWAETSRNHRQNIRMLIRRGFIPEMDRWEFFPQFKAIYAQTMERCDAIGFYFFSDAYFDALRDALAGCLHLCTVTAPNGEIAAAGLFTVINGLVQAHLCGTDNRYLQYAPAKLMFEHARRWAKDLGCYAMNLGGGVGGSSDSLFHFKSGFSNLRRDFYTYRMVINEGVFDELVTTWHTRKAGWNLEATYFPLYRLP